MSTEHPNELDKIPEDYKFLYKTAQGYVIQRTFQDRYGYLHVVAYRPGVNDYMIARAYDPTKGRWYGQGIYSFDNVFDATEHLLKGIDGPFTQFSPWNRQDVQFEYDAQHNWNEVDSEWLKKHNHRDPGFDTEPHSIYSLSKDNDMSYEEYKRNFRRENQPHRTGDFDIKGGKYAERRARVKRLFKIKRK